MQENIHIKAIKTGFISLGCAKNQVDLEKLAGRLYTDRFIFTNNTAECDLLVINTCGFIRPAVDEAIEAILTAKAELPTHAKLVVMGCMAERYKSELAQELPEIDFFAGVGEDEQEKVLSYVDSAFNTSHSGQGRYRFNLPYYAYLKISEGCDNRCTYCTIPSIRGPHKSVPQSRLLKEARELAAGGAKEIIIVSQDSSKYGDDLGDGSGIAPLAALLAENLPGTYFRIMYINPDGVTEDLINTVAAHPNILRYFDIPVQHASDAVLKRMNRKSRKTQIEDAFRMIRAELPDAFIRTTFIVGFPGETDSDFNELKQFIEDTQPDYAGFFPYSPEDGTPASAMENAVDAKIVKNRLKALQSIQKNNTVKRLKELMKEEITCFIEKPNDDFEFILEGRASFQAPEVDGKLYVTEGIPADGHGPYRAKIHKIAYPDVYVELLEHL